MGSVKPDVIVVGAGRLATSISMELRHAGYTISEIIVRDVRDSPQSLRKARALAAKVGASAVTANSAKLDATLFWFCVPDRDIHNAAATLAGYLALKKNRKNKIRVALHSSGALSSRELDPLRKVGVRVASAHPLMTFVARSNPALRDVPFAVEGDAFAARLVRRLVRDLGGKPFSFPAEKKAAYHAWATMTSPLLVAFLVTLEEAARAAGLAPQRAIRMSGPIIQQTLANHSRLGSARAFSGPLIRGDTDTVAKHLSALRSYPEAHGVYVALAGAAVRKLPVKNVKQIRRLLGRESRS
jgi:predicted short-subunit dehydrogenase-like oxidoreductase (DUF2520 family)